jgi:GAF domain
MAELFNLDDILINEQIASRPVRPARLDLEIQAFHRLIRAFSKSSQDLLNETVETVCELCDSDSAGITLVEKLPDGTEILRWVATAGRLGGMVGQTMPRHHSPCGVVLDRHTPQLFSRPERLYTYITGVFDIAEALLVPWVGSTCRGTLWALTPNEQKKFDSEDLRILQSLTTFASLAISKNEIEASRITQEGLGSAARVANQLAHTMNNPLQALTNSLFLVETGAKEHIRDAKTQVDRLSSLVRGILRVNAQPDKLPLNKQLNKQLM